MSRLANLNVRRKVIAALRRAGFETDEGGNHTIMHHVDGRMTVIPRHREVKPYLLKKILKQCGILEGEYRRLYR